jgi:hypothetical protein
MIAVACEWANGFREILEFKALLAPVRGAGMRIPCRSDPEMLE